MIVVSKIEYVDKILSPSTKSKYPTRIPSEGLRGLGISGNSNVSSWKFKRQFHAQTVETLGFLKESVGRIQIIFNEMEEYWRSGFEDNNITDFSEWSHSLAMDIIFDTIAGKKTWSTASYFLTISHGPKSVKLPNFDEEIIGESSELTKLFAMHLKAIDFVTIYPKIVRNYIPSFRATQMEFLEAIELLYRKLDSLIRERRKEIENTPTDENLKYDMLTLLITANTDRSISDIKDVKKEFTNPLTDEEIREIIIEALAGGVDTTANVFNFTIYYLARYPEVKDRLCQEIDDLFGQNQNRSLTYDDLSSLNYCEAVIKEASRVTTPVPFISRLSSEPDKIENMEWGANTGFLIFISGVHLNNNYWEEPEKFNADRFVSTDEQKEQNGKMFRNWDIELADKNSPLEFVNSSVFRSAKNLM
ncbi:7846_t:CDS:2, partial [Acaulospora colombiana]